MSEEKKNENLDQEVDYKVEYEKLIAEKERVSIVNTFKKTVSDMGLKLNEEAFLKSNEDYSNEMLRDFSSIIKVIDRGPLVSGTPPIDGKSAPTLHVKKSFSDYTNK
ncbi:hypothetical protein [Clostridium sp.]|uniref:hypothetical protein n=1 Tax=Clostridium sp. TaxID=1506 RepID=UPI0032174B88